MSQQEIRESIKSALGEYVATKALSNTIRQILEAKIHDSFTRAADQFAMRGYVTRDERIALSGNIGDVLGKFGESIDKVIAEKMVNPDDVHCIASE